MSEIRIEDKIVMKKISEIKPYIRNPRKNEKTVELLCKIIPKVGFNVPLVIDKNGTIVKGHARFVAAIRLGMTELPCIITHASEDEIKADRIADNKISEFSEWINEEVMHEIDSINLDFDFSDLGFPQVDFDDFYDDFEINDVETDEEKQERYKKYLENNANNNVTFVSEKDIEAATKKQMNTAVEPPKYVKVVCEQCGHIMFVTDDRLWGPDGGLVSAKK